MSEVPVLMILSTLIALSVVSSSNDPQASVSLGRVFTLNEKLNYAVRSNLHAEQRQRGVQTWIPEDLDMNYDFSFHVKALKTDGFASIRYERPTLTQIDGETFDRPPKTRVDKLNWMLEMDISPFNEITELKDVAPKKAPPKAPAKAGSTPPKKKGSFTWALVSNKPQGVDSFLQQFVGEVYRLSLFVGPLDSSLDFAPRTPFQPVKVGDTWQRTVGYQPQVLKGRDGKIAPQRLDYTFTYKGLVDSSKGKVHRVEAKLKLDTDLVEYIHQLANVNADQTGLKTAPLKMDATILYDLDQKTKHTLLAQASSDASFRLVPTEDPEEPLVEEKIRGRTTMRLVGRSIVPPAKKK